MCGSIIYFELKVPLTPYCIGQSSTIYLGYMTVQLQVVPASSTLGTSGGQEASTGYSVFLSKDQFDTALYIVFRNFRNR